MNTPLELHFFYNNSKFIEISIIVWQIDEMEEVAQGRVWTGKDAASQGLVDAIGGLSRAVAIAKQKANIPQDTQVGSIILLRIHIGAFS